MYANNPVIVPHPCCADFHDTKNPQEHYQNLLFVKRHKCIRNHCLRQKKLTDGTEYGQPYCIFRFSLDFQWTWSIEFVEMENSGVMYNLMIKRNDPRMNQNCKIHLNSWMGNCDFQIVLDKDQTIWYLVNYASKAETYSTNMSEILQSLVPLIINSEQSEGDD